jgi:Flp pilus assembly protein TadG
MKRGQMKRGRTEGATSVEFAIVGVAFVSLLLLTLETGYQMLVDAALNSGGRAASRFGTTGATVPYGTTKPATRTDSLFQVVIQNSGGVLAAEHLTVGYMSYASAANLAAGKGGTAGPGTAGQVVRYTFTYVQPYLTPVAAAITGKSQLVHSVTVTVINEPFPAT